jgi:hypothetical protein
MTVLSGPSKCPNRLVKGIKLAPAAMTTSASPMSLAAVSVLKLPATPRYPSPLRRLSANGGVSGTPTPPTKGPQSRSTHAALFGCSRPSGSSGAASPVRRVIRSPLVSFLKLVPSFKDPIEVGQGLLSGEQPNDALMREPLAYLAFANAAVAPVQRYEIDPATGQSLMSAMSGF